MDKEKLVPELRFSEFDGDWEESKIEEHYEFKNGLNKGGDFFGHGLPIINFMDVYKLNSIKKNDINGLVELTPSEIERYEVKKGDVFFTRTSETIIDIGMSATLVEDIENCVFSGFVLRARPKNKLLDPYFTSYCFQISPVRKEITTKSSMTTRALTSGTNLNKVIFRFPKEIKEQQKIGNFLTAIDQRIILLKQKKAALEQYKKGLMQKIFSQEVRFKDDGKDFPDWEEKRLGDIADCLDNKRKPLNSTSRQDMKGSIPYYGANGVVDYLNDYLFDQELILLAEDGGNFDEFANRPIAQYVTGKSWVNNHAHVLSCKGENIGLMLYYSLVHKDVRKYINGSSRAKLNKSDMLSIKLLWPRSIEEQQKIADCLNSIDQSINHLSKQIDQTNEFKKGLLQRMFV